MIDIFALFFWIVLFAFLISKNKKGSATNNINFLKTKLHCVFSAQNFSNIVESAIIPGITIIFGNSHGENYLFAIKKSSLQFSMLEIDKLYDTAQKLHVHNVVIISQHFTLSDNTLQKITNYNIQLWDEQKLETLVSSPSSNSVLTTSDTSDDTCIIDNDQFDPIQEPTSFFEKLFKKPDKL